MYILKISDFNEIVKGIKAMKADLVCVYHDRLIGVDNTLSMIKEYKMDTVIASNPFTIITKELSKEFYANITDTSIIIDTNICKIYCPNNMAYANSKENPMIDLSVTDIILDRIYKLTTIASHPMTRVIDFGDVTDDFNLQAIRNLRAADGAQIYCPNNNQEYGMYLYSGALPAVKTDKIYLKIYDSGDTFLGNFIIQKKKLNPINVYFRFIKVNRMR